MERYDVDFRLAKETGLGEPILANEEGARAIEYGLIASLTALAYIIAFASLGLNLTNAEMASDAFKPAYG